MKPKSQIIGHRDAKKQAAKRFWPLHIHEGTEELPKRSEGQNSGLAHKKARNKALSNIITQTVHN